MNAFTVSTIKCMYSSFSIAIKAAVLQAMLTLTSIKPPTAFYNHSLYNRSLYNRSHEPLTVSLTPCPFLIQPLSQVDQNRSDEVIISLKQYLKALPFAFKDATILTGQQEGLYGWVTVNYLMGNFEEVRSRPRHGGP